MTNSGGSSNKPNGGFPPIYLCKTQVSDMKIRQDDKTKREYETHKTTVSIKSILEKRRQNAIQMKGRKNI